MFKSIKPKTLIILIAFLNYFFVYISGKQNIVGHFKKTYIKTNLPQSFPEESLTINETKVSRIKHMIPYNVVKYEILTNFFRKYI